MLQIGVIGIGNTGNQVAKLAHERLGIKVLAINSSEKDLDTIGDLPKILIQNAALTSQGAGKDRKLAKTYMKDTIDKIIGSDELKTLLHGLDIVFIVSSTGGGTGSGVSPMFAKILSTVNKNCKVILVGVLPINSEALSSHVNTLEYLDELYNTLDNATYMLYDNDRTDEVSSVKKLEKVNEEIVSDFDVLRCMYNIKTKYDSIDDRDNMRLIGFPGRIVVTRLEDFNEKAVETVDIETQLIDIIKNKCCHVETQRNNVVMASGIITNISQKLMDELDLQTPKVRAFVGEPLHTFVHAGVNEDRNAPNNVFYILSGLTKINDKIQLISDRIKEIQDLQKRLEEDDELNNIDISALSGEIEAAEANSGIELEDKKNEKEKVNLDTIFDMFM